MVIPAFSRLRLSGKLAKTSACLIIRDGITKFDSAEWWRESLFQLHLRWKRTRIITEDEGRGGLIGSFDMLLLALLSQDGTVNEVYGDYPSFRRVNTKHCRIHEH